MKICSGFFIIGHFYNRGGYADMAHQYVMACQEIGIPVRMLVTGEEIQEVKAKWSSIVESSTNIDIGLNPFALIIDIPPRFRLVDVAGVAKVIGVTIFEGDSIPFDWVNHCGLVDELWLPTDFNIKSFTASGVDVSRIKKVPLGVDTNFWDSQHPLNRQPNKRKPCDPIKLLYVCSLHRRKGLERLITAYFQEFNIEDNVELVISSFPIRSGGMKNDLIVDDFSFGEYLNSMGMSLSGRTSQLPKVKAFFRYWELEELRNLFFEADAYVSTERADGWALPVMQMMSLGKPTMLLGWGGSTEYSCENIAYLVKPGPLEPVDPYLSWTTPWYRGQHWPSMSLESIRQALRSLVSDIKIGSINKAIAARKLVLEKYTYESLGIRISQAAGWINTPLQAIQKIEAHAEVKVREQPYVGSWIHSLLSRVRSHLYKEPNDKVCIVSASSDETKQIQLIAERNKIPVVVVSELDDKYQFLRSLSLIILTAQELIYSNQNENFEDKKIFYYDRVSQSLVPKNSKLPISEPVIYLTGGLTEEIRKMLIARGLIHCPLITHIHPDKRPGSWSVFKSIYTAKEAHSLNPSDVFIADENPSQQRESYQKSEIIFKNAAIHYIQHPKINPTLPVLTDEEIFRCSIPKRWRDANKGAIRNILILPAIQTAQDLATLLTRISYFFPKSSGIQVIAAISNNLFDVVRNTVQSLRSDLGQDVYGRLVNLDISHIEIIDAKELPSRQRNADATTLIWSLDKITNYERRLLNLTHNILLVDVDHAAMRSGFVAAYGLYFCQSRKVLVERKIKSMQRLKQHIKFLHDSDRKKVTVFGTGPSLADAFNHDFSDSITIACNTMVKDRELLNHIKPDFIVASDADFHFGPSKYAQQFRIDLCDALKNHDAMFLCPEAHADLLLAHHPDIEHRLISIPVDGSEPNYDLTKELRVAAIDNVLLQFLLPLAATVGKRIQLLGFDGRKKEDKKFWNHNVNTQYTELMDTIESSHPGFFFHRSYSDYFIRHSRLIEEYINDIEKMGVNLQSLADSAVPALSQRQSPI